MSEWEKVRLGDVCDGISSNIAQKDLADNEGEYPIYGASGLIKHVDFFVHDQEYVAVVKDGAGVGRTTIHPAKSSVIGTMQALIPKIMMDTRYLYYAVSKMNLAKYYSGSTIPHIYFRDYKEELFLLPPMKTQKRIVTILDKICNFIKKQEIQVKMLELLVKSRFVEMFGDPVQNTKGLEVKELATLGTLERGRSRHRPRNAPELLGGPYSLIQIGDVVGAGFYLTEFSSTYSEIGLQQSRMWEAGTLCITIAANIAQTTILKFDSCFPDSVVGFIPDSEVTAEYMYYWFTFFQQLLEKQAPQVAQKNINLEILSKLQVIVPNVSQVQQFTDFAKQTDKSKFAIQKSLEELETLKKALMQQYFG